MSHKNNFSRDKSSSFVVPCLSLSLSLSPSFQQCDQMARLFVQYLAIYNDENLLNGINILPKSTQSVTK